MALEKKHFEMFKKFVYSMECHGKKFHRNIMNNYHHQTMNRFAHLVVKYEAVRQTSIMFTDTEGNNKSMVL